MGFSVCFEPSVDWIFPSFVTPTCQVVCIPSSLHQPLVSWMMNGQISHIVIDFPSKSVHSESTNPEVEHQIFQKVFVD